ncbi:carboxylesterase family protein [Penicillium cf. viridicatum]|uniref:Carboxylic ester hydrolase n=1 Tax=Penicillium cf. viridicatum TaxID=2972119 RepID=A0A9W9T986_9EURO|nr:carboxylesterase family protein [Penicillium cf. viridicatum]
MLTALLLSCALLLRLSDAIQPAPTAVIRNDTVKGLHNSAYNQDLFLGIPFAQPPVGNLRFARPKPLNTTWPSPLAVTQYGKFCNGRSLRLPGFDPSAITYPEDEDCLTLNVVRPSVLFWIPGGGYQEGGGGDSRYNMSAIVKTSVEMGSPIIAVSINYRLSILGFPSGQAFRDQNQLNLGLYDQRLALHWVQENIAAFGGNTSRVTIQGESAGAASDEGLFHAAIAQSGGPFYYASLFDNQTQDTFMEQVYSATGCASALDPVICLRDVPAPELVNASLGITWAPVIDHDLVTQRSSVALEKGDLVRVPLLIGANANEGASFVPAFSTISVNTSSEFISGVTAFGGGHVLSGDVLDLLEYLYRGVGLAQIQRELGTVLNDPGAPYGSWYGSMSLALGDFAFISGRRISAETWAQQGLDAYSYRFDTLANGISAETLGSCHFLDVAFVFRGITGVGYTENPFEVAAPLRQRYLDLSTLMSRMWVSFVTTGSPNAQGVSSFPTAWPMYDVSNPQNMVFNATAGTHLETDTWRSEEISLIHQVAKTQNRK